MDRKNAAITIFIAILFIISSSSLPSFTKGAGTPHAIIGYILDEDFNGILGATVYVNNTRTNDSLIQFTNNLGQYSVDIGDYPNGYLIGDVLSIHAEYHIYGSTKELTITSEPAQQNDLILNFKIHTIEGYVFKSDGSPASHFPILVTNQDRNESKYSTSAIDGYYRIDLSLYINGFAVDDDIIVSIDFNGFAGSNYTTISETYFNIINITLSDTQPPAISLYEVPSNITIGDQFRVLVWVIDNQGVDGVKLFLKSTGQTLFTRYDMIGDDGLSNDWNGDHIPNMQLYGQSTGRNIPIQTNIGFVSYYFETSDVNNTVTLPAANPQVNAFQIQVMDPTPPTLSHVPITRMESGQSMNIVAIAKDNIGISQVNLFYRNSTVSTFSRNQMLFTGNPDEYNATIPSQMYLGTLEYFITCNDTSNNTVRSPASGYYLINVLDTTLPIIIHNKLNSAKVWKSINFTCQVTEIWRENVWLNLTDVNNNPQNNSMQLIDGNWYYLNETKQNNTGVLYYTIWANDTSGNIAHISHAMAINDNNTPLITHIPPEHLNYGQSTSINAFVEDDVAIANATLFYKPLSAPAFIKAVMTSIDLNVMMRNYTANIPPQTSLEPLEYFIQAFDGANNNITWPALSPSYQIAVLDLVPPVLFNLSYNATGPANFPVVVRVNASDNHIIGKVSLQYLNSTNVAWQSIAMSPLGSGVFEVMFPAHKPDIVKFYISASDFSGNNVTLPNVQPKLNSYAIEFLNTTIPGIHTKASISIGVNQTCNVYVMVSDNRENAETDLFYKGTQDSVFVSTQLTLFQNGTFVGKIPIQNRSGNIQYYAKSREGTTILNQTHVFNISVINRLPVIYHVGVESAPVDENVAVVAMVSDDLHVESVTFSWKRDGTTQYTDIPMVQNISGIYTVDISQSLPVIIQYHITATDTEGQSQFPILLDLETSIMDLEAPLIIHQPILNLTTVEIPIIIANVTDNIQVSSVQVWVKNSTANTYSSTQMIQASGSDDYVALLDRQSGGNFTYYLEASDGINTARSPSNGTYTVEVELIRGSGWASTILLALVLVLIAVAVFLVYIYYRRKSNK